MEQLELFGSEYKALECLNLIDDTIQICKEEGIESAGLVIRQPIFDEIYKYLSKLATESFSPLGYEVHTQEIGYKGFRLIREFDSEEPEEAPADSNVYPLFSPENL